MAFPDLDSIDSITAPQFSADPNNPLPPAEIYPAAPQPDAASAQNTAPARQNMWLQFLQNLNKGGGGGVGGQQQVSQGHNMSSQSNQPMNPVMQQAAGAAAKGAASSMGLGAMCGAYRLHQLRQPRNPRSGADEQPPADQQSI